MNRTPPARCLVPSCPHVGYWFTSHGRCPPHFAELLEQTRAAIVRHRNPEPEPPASPGFLSDPVGILAMPSHDPGATRRRSPQQ